MGWCVKVMRCWEFDVKGSEAWGQGALGQIVRSVVIRALGWGREGRELGGCCRGV